MPDTKNLQLPGYTMHTNNNLQLQDTRGTCIYINNEYKSSEVTIQNHNFTDTISVEVEGKNQSKALISCIYRSGSPEKALQRDPEMYRLLRSLALTPGYQTKTVVGDFNMNKITWTPDPELPPNISEDSAEYKFVECMRDTFLHQNITEPTRFREGNQPTCDDLLFSSYENTISDLLHEAPLGHSDHVSITCNINTNLKPVTTERITYNYNKADFPKMKNMFNKDWETILQGKNVQEASDLLEEAYNKAVDECVPKYKNKSGKYSPKPIWMNGGAFRKVKRKYSSWIRFLNTKQSQTYREYIRKRNESTLRK